MKTVVLRIPPALSLTVCLLNAQGPCFRPGMVDDAGVGDEEDDEDDDTIDGNVANASCDLVGAFAKVSGSSRRTGRDK